MYMQVCVVTHRAVVRTYAYLRDVVVGQSTVHVRTTSYVYGVGNFILFLA